MTSTADPAESTGQLNSTGPDLGGRSRRGRGFEKAVEQWEDEWRDPQQRGKVDCSPWTDGNVHPNLTMFLVFMLSRLCTFWISMVAALLSIMISGRIYHVPNTAWNICASVAGGFHYFSNLLAIGNATQGLCGYFAQVWRTRPWEELKRIANWPCLYLSVLLCLWLEWWTGLAAAKNPKSERHGKFNLPDTCHISVAIIYLSGINAVLLFLMLTAALLDAAEQYPAFQDISWRVRFKKSALKHSTQEAEAEALLIYYA